MAKQRQVNPSDKAKKSRVYRRNRREERKFESPLREFIEIKYRSIFEEYTVLYKKMVEENPNKIDLKKSETFKQWKWDQLNPDVLSQAIAETIGETNNTEVNETNNTEVSETNNTEVSETNNSEVSETNSSEVSEAINNIDYESEVLDEGMLAARQVDELVNEMFRDDQLRELLNTQVEDEGIELNIEEEIDIEPFDYNLEVETFNW